MDNPNTTQKAMDDTETSINAAAKSAKEVAVNLSNDAQAAFATGFQESKVESVIFFNKHLNGYSLDAQVQNNIATLTGTVSSDIEKDYAQQLALGVVGIEKVVNNIKVDKTIKKSGFSDTATQVTSTLKDLAITAQIKAQLYSNPNVSGTDISVTTQNQQVTLEGTLSTSLEKDLVEQIVTNTNGVNQLHSQLQVTPKTLD